MFNFNRRGAVAVFEVSFALEGMLLAIDADHAIDLAIGEFHPVVAAVQSLRRDDFALARSYKVQFDGVLVSVGEFQEECFAFAG